MQQLPVQSQPELASVANLWLPVQSYYAFHGVGLACMAALGQEIPRDHRAFRAQSAKLVSWLFPTPFSVSCSGGPTPAEFTFSGIKTSPKEIAEHNALTTPHRFNADVFIGKCLSTTRERLLDENVKSAQHQNVSKGKTRRNVKSSEKQKISERLNPTTVCDFIYRIRFRSNYDNPDMYLYSAQFQDDAVELYQNVTRLTQLIVLGLSTIIKKKIGSKAFSRLESMVG